MKNTSRFMDIIDRCLQGPVVSEAKFDLEYVSQGIQKTLKKYDICLEKDRVVNQDDELADRLFEAAVDFLAECGIYCTSTGRVITFDREEILSIIKEAPAEVQIGGGTDTRLEYHREVEDSRPPLVIGGPVGSPYPEELLVPIMRSYIQEPVVDATTGGFLETVYGREIRTRSPLEILAAWEEVDLMLLAMKQAGRPGMPVLCPQMSISEIGFLSTVNRGGWRTGDLRSIAMVGELKTNYELLNRVAHTLRQDGPLHGFYNPVYGGLCGGSDGLALLLVAGIIAVNLVYMASSHATSPPHPFLANNTGREILSSLSIAIQALSRNTHLITSSLITPVSGPGTKSLFHECLAFATCITVSGVSHAFGVRSAAGVESTHFSGLEARFFGESAHAATRLDRGQAEEIVQRALAEYEAILDKRPIGKPFSEVYDVKKVQPTREWLNLYDQVKAEVIGWGVPME
jgi:methylamine--corrinoid protein Co-methyltransferase